MTVLPVRADLFLEGPPPRLRLRLYFPIVRPKEVHLTGLRPRRQRDLHRGRRARGPGLSARARPSRRPPAARSARQGPAQSGHEGAAPAGHGWPCGHGPCHRRAAGALTADRLAFLGTPEAAVPPLRALHDAGHDLRLVVIAGGQAAGPGRRADPEPGQGGGGGSGPAGHRPGRRRDRVGGADSAWWSPSAGSIKPQVLTALPLVNVHFSLLPRWRGAAPVERAILAGDPSPGCVS